MRPNISIVVPIYNVEKYLNECIQSLINQTYKNIEIILVDDGSPDNCPKICDEYSKIDNRIKTVHKLNGGLSDARNRGLRESIGKYILFVDSDDYIELDTCERFISEIDSKSPDIVVGNARRIVNDKITIMQHSYITRGESVTGKDYLKKELRFGVMYMAACLNLYKRSFLIENELEFKVGLLHEDEQFTPRVFLNAKQVIGTDIIFYNYRIREGSITTSKDNIKNAEHLMKICKELEGIYRNIDDVELRKLLNDTLVNKFLNIFQVAGLHRKQYAYLVDMELLKGKAYTKRNKYRVAVFKSSSKLYYFLNLYSKRIKNGLSRIKN